MPANERGRNNSNIFARHCTALLSPASKAATASTQTAMHAPGAGKQQRQQSLPPLAILKRQTATRAHVVVARTLVHSLNHQSKAVGCIEAASRQSIRCPWPRHSGCMRPCCTANMWAQICGSRGQGAGGREQGREEGCSSRLCWDTDRFTSSSSNNSSAAARCCAAGVCSPLSPAGGCHQRTQHAPIPTQRRKRCADAWAVRRAPAFNLTSIATASTTTATAAAPSIIVDATAGGAGTSTATVRSQQAAQGRHAINGRWHTWQIAALICIYYICTLVAIRLRSTGKGSLCSISRAAAAG